MKQFTMGLAVGVILSAVCLFSFQQIKNNTGAEADTSAQTVKEATFQYVDFRFKDLALSDIAILVKGQVYVKPEKLLGFIGKELHKDERSDDFVIEDKPENAILGASTVAIGQLSKGTIGDMLNQKFQSQHWDADPEEENKLVFKGVDLNKNNYEIVFYISQSNEMAIQSILLNGTELSEQARIHEIKRLFGTQEP